MRILFALALWLAVGAVAAQTGYPEKPVRILVGFTPGVAPDITARLLADKRLEELGLDVIGSSPAEFAALIKTELPQWAKVIKGAGIKATE